MSCPDTPTPWTSWQFWQYADNGSVPGISGAVDLDEFNGTLAQLQAIGGPAPYAAQYVSQSFPLATTALTMVEGQTIPSYIELKNVGTKTWDSSTHLGTTAAARSQRASSPTARGSRRTGPRGVSGTVAAGRHVQVPVRPARAGHSGHVRRVLRRRPGGRRLVQRSRSGRAAGQRPRGAGEGHRAANTAATFKDQSFPLAPTALTVHMGDVATGYIELTNSGTEPWKAGTTKLAPIPRDKASPVRRPVVALADAHLDGRGRRRAGRRGPLRREARREHGGRLRGGLSAWSRRA